MNQILTRDFYRRPATQLAQALLGCHLVRVLDGIRMEAIVIETEAYQGAADQACHARVGKTERTSPMYAEPGHAYIYFTYGMHWLLNAVADEEGEPAAVLIRAVVPLLGMETMAGLRPRLAYTAGWLNGPAKLCQALGLDGNLNRADLCEERSGLFFTAGQPVPPEAIRSGPRVGIDATPEPWRSIPWRWWIDPQCFDEAGSVIIKQEA